MDCFWFISPSKKNIPHIPLGNSPMFTCTFCQVIWRQPKISHSGPGSLGIRPNPNRGLETCHHPAVPTSKSRSTRQKQRRFWEFGQAKARCFRKAWKIIKKVWYTRSLSTKCWLYPSTSEPTKLVQEPRTGKIFRFWLLNRRHLGGSTTWKWFLKIQPSVNTAWLQLYQIKLYCFYLYATFLHSINSTHLTQPFRTIE